MHERTEWDEESRLAEKKDHEEDIELGARIAQKNTRLTLHDFTNEVYNTLDYNRFDYEGGEFEMVKAVICAHKGYMLAGGEIDFSEVMPNK